MSLRRRLCGTARHAYPVAVADAHDLTTLDGLAAAMKEVPLGAPPHSALGMFDGTFCPACRHIRRMNLYSMVWVDRWAPGHVSHYSVTGTNQVTEDPTPSMYLAICTQCDSSITLVVHKGPDGLQLVALPSTYGGLATPNTPEAVAYYLTQAQRAQSVAANSAAIAMYRAALEHVLLDQGYDQRMLGPKIQALLDDNDPPSWRDRLDPVYLQAIKDLGNAALHTNDGTLDAQQVFEAELLREVEALFVGLLDEVYERHRREEAVRDRLQAAVEATRENRPPSA